MSTASHGSRTLPAGRSKDDRHSGVREAFLAAVWGSEEDAQKGIRVCRDYDEKHFEL